MKTLYLDCGMGAAGDMLAAALLDLLPDPDAFLAECNAVGLPLVHFTRQTVESFGVTGMRLNANCPKDAHRVRILAEVLETIDRLEIPAPVREDIRRVYWRIAEAESAVHACPQDQVHFHEVGAPDAVAEIAMFCLLRHRLSPDRIAVSPIRVGTGTVRCAHGILSVPAPVTAYLVKGIPTFAGDLLGELCTPTGAALLTCFADDFGEEPSLRGSRTGRGMGTKALPVLSCVRAVLGTQAD